MIDKTILGSLILLIGCFGNKQTSIDQTQIEEDPIQYARTNSGLQIENGINRGISYTNSEGINYNLRYIPITIVNDTTISIHIQMAFSKEYNYPEPAGNEKFRIIPLPKEWALDGKEVSESMINKLPSHIENPVLEETIEAGEKIVLAIGSLYPSPVNTTGVLPRILFDQVQSGIFPECDGHTEEHLKLPQFIPLMLKISFGEKCRIIRCGQISYPNQ